MKEKKNSQIARLLAVLALIGTGLVLVVVIAGARDGNGDSGQQTEQVKKQPSKPKRVKKIYVVEPGDTLVSIEAKTGVSIEKIERLNPEIDTQTLQVGEKIRLR